MTRLHHCVFLLFLIAFPLYVQAGKRVTFQDLPSVSIRQTNRILVRGELKSVDPTTVVIRVGSGFTAKEVEIDVETISTLRTVDGDIQFQAADGIDSFISSLSSRLDVDITSVAVSTSNPSTATPENSAPVNGGFGTATSSSSNTSKATDSPAMNPVLNGGFGPSGTQNSSTDTGSPGANGQKVIVICENCNKEVAVNAEYGQECPHCGILWDVGTPAVTMPNNPTNSQMANNTSPSDGGGGGLQPVANRVQAPDGSAPPSIQNPPAPITMENLPLWMKASIFFGCIGVLYYFFFYRA